MLTCLGKSCFQLQNQLKIKSEHGKGMSLNVIKMDETTMLEMFICGLYLEEMCSLSYLTIPGTVVCSWSWSRG